jgi:thioredoxin-dependent peroxiredoxin
MRVGDTAPEFTLSDQSGVAHSLTAMLEDGPVVLFFYPAAMTSGCTRESCQFRDMAADYKAAGAQRVGISMDSVAKQRQFSDAHNFDFPLLADEDGSVARAYGVKRPLDFLKVRRSTFVIGRDGIVKGVVASELQPRAHAERALAILAR